VVIGLLATLLIITGNELGQLKVLLFRGTIFVLQVSYQWARLGLYKDEPDPGWWVLNALHNLGIVKNIKLPKELPHRSELVTEATDLERRVERVPEECEIANFIRRNSNK
jgi:hypothetical protein